MLGRKRTTLAVVKDDDETRVENALAAALKDFNQADFTAPTEPVNPAGPMRDIDVKIATARDEIEATRKRMTANRSEASRFTELADQDQHVLTHLETYLAGLETYPAVRQMAAE